MGTLRGGSSTLGDGRDSGGHSPEQPDPALKLGLLGTGVGPSPPSLLIENIHMGNRSNDEREEMGLQGLLLLILLSQGRFALMSTPQAEGAEPREHPSVMEGPSRGRGCAEPVLEAGAALARVSGDGGKGSRARPWRPEGAGDDGTFPGAGDTSPNAEQGTGEESSVLCLSLGTFPPVLTQRRDLSLRWLAEAAILVWKRCWKQSAKKAPCCFMLTCASSS